MRTHRLLYGSLAVIAANAGGAWTPIGDVTTTMLWIGGQVLGVGVAGVRRAGTMGGRGQEGRY